jgi:hypothetical protein
MPTKAILHHIHVETPEDGIIPRTCKAHMKGNKAHKILAADTRLIIVDDDKALRYCPQAAADILDLAQRDLNVLRRQPGSVNIAVFR